MHDVLSNHGFTSVVYDTQAVTVRHKKYILANSASQTCHTQSLRFFV